MVMFGRAIYAPSYLNGAALLTLLFSLLVNLVMHRKLQKSKHGGEYESAGMTGSIFQISLKPVAVRLSELLGKEVKFVPAAIGPESEAARAAMKDGDVVLLENVRFYPGEKKNDPEFAKALLGNATLFVNDAFGTAHRLSDPEEITVMGGALQDPKRPFVAILGGAKVSDKIGVIDNLISKVDT